MNAIDGPALLMVNVSMDLRDPQDIHHLNAAIGWLELGNHLEANEELEQINPLNRAHPDVLEVRWRIYEKAKRWGVCIQLAEAMRLMAPEDPRGIIRLAQAHCAMREYLVAYQTLKDASHSFPDSCQLVYDLARYACLLGRMEEARDLLSEACRLDESNETKLKSLDDPDLKSLWDLIGILPPNQAGKSDVN